MMHHYTVCLVILISIAVWTRSEASTERRSVPCSGLAAYRLTIETLWSKEDFPKQYPLYRPPAQWSRLIGRTHSSQYSMWALNRTANPALKEFIEKSTTTLLDGETQGSGGVFDVFVAPNIKTGVGVSEVTVYADAKHSKLSTVSLLIPSPDWFIGVHDLDLCGSNGRWIERHVTNLHPMDAGVDRGLTFSAPNWPENNPVPITQITSKVPNHPAASFNYPELENLKPLGRVSLVRVSLSTEERFVVAESKQMRHGYEQVPTYRTANNERFKHISGSVTNSRTDTGTDLAAVSKRLEEESKALREQERIDRERKQELRHQQRQLRKSQRQQERSQHESRSGARNNASVEIEHRIEVRERLEEVTTASFPSFHGTDRIACEVGAWTEWSDCSKTCGYGRKTRTRLVTRNPENGGTPCPLLREETLCGSMRGCDWNHFSHMSWEKMN